MLIFAKICGRDARFSYAQNATIRPRTAHKARLTAREGVPPEVIRLSRHEKKQERHEMGPRFATPAAGYLKQPWRCQQDSLSDALGWSTRAAHALA